jgi:hypothetical protein
MAQRSLHGVTKVYYRSMSCFATVPEQTVPASSAKVSHANIPSCTMWFRQFTKYVTKYDHKVWCRPHSTEHDTQPIAYLISKQAIPYQTCGGTYCPGVSTPKIQSLADLSKTDHITEWNLTVSTIPTSLKPQHRSSPQSSHISMDGRSSLTKTQAKLNITKNGKTCTTLMTKERKDLYNTHDCMTKHN